MEIGCSEVILCEYSHALGNSNGSLHSYWQLFWSNAPATQALKEGSLSGPGCRSRRPC